MSRTIVQPQVANRLQQYTGIVSSGALVIALPLTIMLLKQRQRMPVTVWKTNKIFKLPLWNNYVIKR